MWCVRRQCHTSDTQNSNRYTTRVEILPVFSFCEIHQSDGNLSRECFHRSFFSMENNADVFLKEGIKESWPFQCACFSFLFSTCILDVIWKRRVSFPTHTHTRWKRYPFLQKSDGGGKHKHNFLNISKSSRCWSRYYFRVRFRTESFSIFFFFFLEWLLFNTRILMPRDF